MVLCAGIGHDRAHIHECGHDAVWSGTLYVADVRWARSNSTSQDVNVDLEDDVSRFLR